MLNLDTGVTLTLLSTPSDSLLFLLRYGDFTTLVPFEISQETQTELAPKLPVGLTLLPAPYPGTGAWPHPDLLAHLRPQVTLVPEGVTYPQSVQQALAASTAVASIPNAAAIDIATDGRTFTLTARPYPQDLPELP